MPVPHLEIRIVQRSKGSSAVAGAAYQAGEKLFSEYDQKMKNYLYKKEVVYTEVMLPTNAPPGYADRATLWNAAEEVEKQWNSQLARRFVVALPREAPTAMYPQMMQEYCQEHFVSKGMCCDFAIHDPDPPGHNPHCHIMLTMRAIDENGKWLPKNRKVYDLDENGERIRLPSGNWKSHKEDTVDWNEQYHAEEWRHGWELVQNKYLLIYYIGYFFYSSANVSGSLNLFVSFYLFNNSQFSLVVQALSLVPAAIFSFLVPHMVRKFDKMKLFRICTLATVILSVVMWLIGYNSMKGFIIISILRAVPMAILGVMLFMFTPDCAEFGKFTSGIEAKGITFAIQTFMCKLTAAVSGALGMFILGLKSTGWVSVEGAQNFADLQGVTQTDHAKAVLWFIYVMFTAIGYAIAYVIWTRYKLTDKDVQTMADCNSGKITRAEAEERLGGRYDKKSKKAKK